MCCCVDICLLMIVVQMFVVIARGCLVLYVLEGSVTGIASI